MKIPPALGSIVLAAFCAASVQAETGSARNQTIAVVGGTVIDGNGGAPLANGVVLIEGRKIAAVGPAAAVRIPAKARRIQAEGKYVIPGLIDANVHLGGVYSLESVLGYENRLQDLVLEGAQIALKNGVTTAFESWGPLAALEKVRDDIDSGRSAGTRLFIAGNIVGFTGIFGNDFNGKGQEILSGPSLKRTNDIWEQGSGPELMYMTPEQVRERMRAYLAKGVDFVKYGVNQHGSAFIAFSPRVQKVLVEETHRAGKIIQTHTMSVEGVDLAMEAGVDMMQHCDVTGPVPLPEETIRLLVERRMPCAVLAYTNDYLKETAEQSVGKAMDYPVMDANVRNLIKAGANLLLSTDAYMKDPNMNIPEAWEKILNAKNSPTRLGPAHFLWLQAMDEKGFDPMKNLQAATRNIAEAYQVLDRLGTVEAGKFADLLVLDANPLDAVENYRKIHAVIKEGVEVDRQALPVKPVFSKEQ